jgi:hypothetical protein
MPNIDVSRADIDSLRDRLSEFESNLSDQERALLVAIFSLATDALKRARVGVAAKPAVLRTGAAPAPPIVVGVTGELPSIREQFELAFTPGPFETSEGGIGVGVGAGYSEVARIIQQGALSVPNIVGTPPPPPDDDNG